MRCRSCQAENDPTRQYCGQCGVPLRVACGHCRFSNDPEDRFCGGCGRPLAATPAGSARSASDETFAVGAERRQVTLMFVDLVGSTALSERLDPEDMGDLYLAYREGASRIIEDYGGFVAQFLGDGILVYFGFPRAHDEDAVRAVQAALDIGPAVQRLDGGWNRSQRVQLDVRAGLHSGVVVAGALGTGVKSDQLAVVGGTSNVAARIQNYAQPGEVMITGATWQLIEGRFECEDLGRHPMRGVREPVHILRVLRPSTRLTRFEAAKEIGELVDREAGPMCCLAGRFAQRALDHPVDHRRRQRR